MNIISDKERIKQVLSSCLESAIYETGSHGVINVHLLTKSIEAAEDSTRKRISKSWNFCDFNYFLVCQIDFKPHVSFEQRTSKLESLSLESVFEKDRSHQALLLSLITSQKICESFYGELKESERGNRIMYEATFIAEIESEFDQPDYKIKMKNTLKNGSGRPSSLL